MPDTQLHGLNTPEDSQLTSRAQIRRNISAEGALSGGESPVEALSLEPGERLLTGQFRGLYADVMAAEFEELFDAPDIESVPLFDPNNTHPNRGYFSLSNIDTSPLKPQIPEYAHEFSGRLRRIGTRKTHWRATETEPTQIENDFGNDQTALVGISANASKVRWLDPTDKNTASVSVHSTVTTELGDVDRYDAQAPSFDNPILIYELDYGEEYQVDPLVYDTRGNVNRADGNGIVQWQRVFRPAHDFEGKIVFDNGELRLTFDEANSTLSAENWDGSSWTSTALGNTGDAANWELFDVDVHYIGLSRIRAQVLWEDTTDGSLYALECQLPRGYENAQWFVPEGETPPTPSGLDTKLSPIADTQDFSAQTVQTLQRREEVRL